MFLSGSDPTLSSPAIRTRFHGKQLLPDTRSRIPVTGFYHSHFPEAYLRSTEKYLGQTATEVVMDAARRYVCKLYNQFEVTFVPSLRLAKLLEEWGVENVRGVNLGVNTEVFRPGPNDAESTRESLGVTPEQKLLALHRAIGAGKKHADAFSQFRNTRATLPGPFLSARDRRRRAA